MRIAYYRCIPVNSNVHLVAGGFYSANYAQFVILYHITLIWNIYEESYTRSYFLSPKRTGQGLLLLEYRGSLYYTYPK